MVAVWDSILWLDDVEPVEHQELGAARHTLQYRRDTQPRLQGELDAFLYGLQSVENVSMDVLTGRWPLTAIGVQLDTLGKIVGQERGEMSDAQYRLWILVRILVNRGNGRTEELIHILDTLGAETIVVDEGTSEIRISVSGLADGDLVGSIIHDAKAGGVRLQWVWSEDTDDYSFQTAHTLGADDTNNASGFGDLAGATQTSGGAFSGSTIS